MRKIFIDCGFNRGRATSSFPNREEYEDGFEYFAFEPMVDSIFKKKNFSEKFPYVFLSKKAVWIEDGEMTFFKNPRRKYQASGLFENKVGESEDVNVETINFPQWLMDNFDKEDKIIVKMDIEGAEYDVIPQMIKDGSIHMIDTLYIEMHKRKAGMHGSVKALKSILKQLENGPIVKGPIESEKYKVDFTKG